ncbi:MAG: protein translocase subunit SecF [Candidatus Wallbacteria bacterium]|nr:protein translocase subunit SecF [Candidatus Wallbacteria bacterium]
MIDFIGKSKIAVTISIVSVVLSLFLIVTRGLNWGVDFKGGTIMHLKLERDADEGKIRAILSDKLNLSSTVQGVKGSPEQVMIRTEILFDNEADGLTKDMVKKKLVEGLGFNIVDVLQATDIGPIVGSQLRDKALKSLILAVFGMLLYITWRFEFKYGLGAVIALLHDCVITIGIFVLLQKEIDITVMAALLTIIGYSINDTIVICDRVRENARLIKGRSFAEVFNISINQSLSRTINTSITTLIPVSILFFVTSGSISNFALAMILGVVIGTYSSMYIVAPVTVHWSAMESGHAKGAVGRKHA